jgi:hypothetical protein
MPEWWCGFELAAVGKVVAQDEGTIEAFLKQ